MYKRIVTSYPDPDTDGVACAMALAYLLGKDWQAVLAGQLGGETEYVLAQCGLTAPVFTEQAMGEELALVDTHHLAQLPPEFPAERVTLIVDHHPKGDDTAFPNARIVNEPVGAAATLIAQRLLEQPAPDVRLLKLLAFAILSNTLNFSAPSTASLDREVYARLPAPTEPEIAGMFARRETVLEQGLENALQSDLKQFDTGSCGRVGIAQLELYGLLDRIDPAQAREALARISQHRDLPFLLFNGVDIRAGKSLVVCANEESCHLAEAVLSLPCSNGYAMADRILLRKTDFLPRFDRI